MATNPPDNNEGQNLTSEYQKGVEQLLQKNQKLNRLYQQGLLTQQDLVDTFQTLNGAMERMGTYYQEHVDLLKQMGKSYTNIEGSNTALLALAGNNAKNQEAINQMVALEAQAAGNLVLQRAMIETHLTGEYAQLLANHLIQEGITDEAQIQAKIKSGELDDLLSELKLRQEIQNKKLDESDLNQAIASQMLEIREEAEGYKKSLEKVLATARAIGNDPKTMGAFMLTQAAKKLEQYTEGFEKFKAQGLSAGQAVQAQFKGMDLYSIMGLSDVKGVTEGMIQQFGNVNALSRDTTQELGKMAVHFGISGQEAAKLNASLSQMAGETSETAAHAMEHVGHMAELQGIAPGKIMKDMATNTGTMALFSKGGAEGFGKAAIELHKMGVEIGTASKMAEGLLDFEGSINKQMEASVLLGREINLDKARELALNGDLEGSTREVLKNIGGSAEFDKMSVVQKKALAEAAGLTVEELAKTIDAQEESNKYFGEGAGIGMNALGYLTEYGSKAAGFFKENGLLILSTLQFLSMGNGLQMISNGLLIAKNVILGIGQGIMMSMVFLDKLLLKGIIGRGAAATGNFVKEQAQALWRRMTENTIFGQWMANMAARRSARIAEAAQEKALAAQSKAAAAGGGGGGGASAGLTGLAQGLSAMGTGKVFFGALNLVIAAPALLLMVAAIPFLGFIAMAGIPAGTGLMGLAEGLESFGSGKTLAGVGVMAAAAVAILALGAATILFAAGGVAGTALMIVSLIALTAALAILGGLGMSGVGFIGVALVLAVGAAMLMLGAAVLLAAIGNSMIVDSFTKMFEVVSIENIGPLLLLGPALMLIGTGMMVMAVGMLVAAPALMLFGLAAAGAAFGITLLGISLGILGLGVAAVAGGLTLIAEAVKTISTLGAPVKETLVQIAESAPGLVTVAGAIGGIALGLGLMAVAGLSALPAITALIGLAAVAPALVALGGAIGGLFGGGGGKEDKMDELIGEIRELKAIMAQGGVINMDGKRVGDVLRLGMTSSGVK